jgi:CheY-like chemotaxis protein
MQGGSVQVYSDGAKKGSEFVVRLPRADVGRAEPAQADAPHRKEAGQRILIVDDYADSADSLAALLRVDGQDVRIACDGPAALETARRFKPSVVFLDIGLPGMNGFQVARALRRMPETKNSRLIAVSGYGQADDHRHSKEAGFDHHLVKPVDLPVLQEILDSTKAGSVPASGGG